MQRKKIIIVGGGPAALMAAHQLSLSFEVHLYEKEKTVGRKFLVAGKGGFNLTNQVRGTALLAKYLPSYFLKDSLLHFDTEATKDWLLDMNIPTFVGTSGRVFPEKGIKPIQVLRELKDKLLQQGVQFHLQHQFIGFNGTDELIMRHQGQDFTIQAAIYIFALGGTSWSKTGSDGFWRAAFEAIGIKTLPFRASNCGLNINWPAHFLKHHEGKPLKNLKISIGNFQVKGEALITKYGLEGNAIYPIVARVREVLEARDQATIDLDLKPFNTESQLVKKWSASTKRTKDYSKSFNLNSLQMALLKAYTDKTSFLSPPIFIKKIKELSIPVESLRPIEEAISSVGGIPLEELNKGFSLKKYPHIYTIGEMVDWDAPTGGFLLQGCFSMGAWAAKAVRIKFNT